MISENHELIIDLWGRLRSHVSAKDRIEVSELVARIFDEYNMLDETILSEELDTELRNAIRSQLGDYDPEYSEYEADYDDEDYDDDY